MLLDLLTAPLGMPISGFKFILNQIAQMVEREILDEDNIRNDLLLLQVKVDEGEISEEEYLAQEAEIMARLRLAREYRESMARQGR